jgi:hypothetical protein
MNPSQVPLRRAKEVEFGLRELILVVVLEGSQPHDRFLDLRDRVVRRSLSLGTFRKARAR